MMESSNHSLPAESNAAEKPSAPVLDEPAPSVAEGTDPALIERIIAALRTVYDPEIPVNIYELGLIYRIDVNADGDVSVDMTLTAPACPVAGEMPGEVQYRIEAVDGVRAATVTLVWDPPWDRSRMSEEAQMALGMY